MDAQRDAGHEIVLYTRAGCSLCDDAKESLRIARRTIAFSLREIDIDSDPRLFALHRFDIPVIEIDGRKAFKLRVDRAALLARLRR